MQFLSNDPIALGADKKAATETANITPQIPAILESPDFNALNATPPAINKTGIAITPNNANTYCLVSGKPKA